MKRSFLFLALLGFSLTLLRPTWAAIPQAAVPSAQVQQGLTASAPALAQSFQRPTAPVDVSTLRSQLEAQNWQAANAETRRILETYIHPNGDIFSDPLATNIPAEVLQTLDQLWVEASGGRFGFSVQKPLWDEVRGQNPANTDDAARAFGDRVGWTRPTPDPENVISPDWLTEPELTYSLEAPVGHLPWVGVGWERINAMLTAQSCGSCTIDAIYLQGERFNRYLPTLFNWLSTALVAPLPAEGSWQQAKLAREINLRSLYPADNACPVYTRAQAISPDSTVVAISSYSYERVCGSKPGNSTLALWNAQRGTRIITLVRGDATESSAYLGQAQEPPTEGTRIVGDVANAVAFTPDGRRVAAGLSNGTVRLWTTDKGELVFTLIGHRYAVRAIAISADGQTLASASADQTINLWNLQTGQLLRKISIPAADGIPHTVLMSPDGGRVAIATERNVLKLWNAQTGQLVKSLVDQPSAAPARLPLAFSPYGQTLATADADNSIKLWNATTGARLITLKGHSEPIHGLAFSPDGQQLASTDENTGRLWNLQTYQSVQTFDLVQSVGHPTLPDNLGYVTFSPDGNVLATSTLLLPLVQSEPIPGQGLTLWDAASGQALAQIHAVSQFQFSPNGEFLMANGQAVQLWQPYRSLISP